MEEDEEDQTYIVDKRMYWLLQTATDFQAVLYSLT